MYERRRPPVSYEDTLPNPEDNPDFELFSERKQDEIDARFQAGIALGQRKRRAEREKRKLVKRARQDFAAGRVGFTARLGDLARVR
jgi:hypothetical protein